MTPRRFTTEDIEKIRIMAACGHNGTAIARSLDRTPQAIRVKCVELGIRLRKPRADRVMHISLDRETAERLRAVAGRKGTTPTRLMRQITETVMRDNLTDAVIDSAPAAKPQPKRRAAFAPPASPPACHIMIDAPERAFASGTAKLNSETRGSGHASGRAAAR